MEADEESSVQQRQRAVQLSIWENTKERGKLFFKVTVLRRHGTDDDDCTKSTSYTGPSNKALARELIAMARRWLQKDHPVQTGEV